MEVDELFQLAIDGEMDKLLLEMKNRPTSDWLIINDERQTLLHAACQGRNINLIRFLMDEKFLNINERADYGITPFHCACETGHVEVSIMI